MLPPYSASERLKTAMSVRQNRVAFLTTADKIGGMERITCGLSREFVKRGWAVRTVFPQTSRQSSLLQWCRDQGVSAEANPALLDAAAPHRWSDSRNLRRFIQKCAPDIVNLHYGDNFISLKDILAVRLAGRHRCVVSVHHPTSWKDTRAKKRILTRLSALIAHDITTFSRATFTVLQEAGIPTSKIHVIPCGLRPPQHLPNKSEARARLGLPPTAFVIGCLARLEPHKGISDLIEAVSMLPNPHGDLLLAIAGDGSERSNLLSLAADRGKNRTLLLGRIPDVDDFFAACDIFALPSHLEGFGLVYVEAAFHGIPSVGTTAGGIPDAVIDSETGLLVSVGDVHALAASIERLHHDATLRTRLGQAAQTRAHSDLTETSMADRFEQLFINRTPS